MGISLPGTEHPLLLSQPFTRQEIIGFVIGSISSVLYLFSRLPQIHTNVSLERGGAEWKRRAGLAAGPLGSGVAQSRRSGGLHSLLAWTT